MLYPHIKKLLYYKGLLDRTGNVSLPMGYVWLYNFLQWKCHYNCLVLIKMVRTQTRTPKSFAGDFDWMFINRLSIRNDLEKVSANSFNTSCRSQTHGAWVMESVRNDAMQMWFECIFVWFSKMRLLMSMFKLAARRSRQKGSFSSRQSDNVTIQSKKTLILPTKICHKDLTERYLYNVWKLWTRSSFA